MTLLERTKIVRQRRPADCGVAALATYLGEPYEDVYVAVAQIDSHRGTKGLFAHQMIKAAAVMGRKLVRKLRVDLDDDEGCLTVEYPKKDGHRHWVVLGGGRFIDPTDQSWTDALEYLATYHAKVYTLLTEESK